MNPLSLTSLSQPLKRIRTFDCLSLIAMANPNEPLSDSSALPLMGWQSNTTPAIHLPAGFPQSVAPPKLWIGSRCRWGSDIGTVIGQVFTASEALEESIPGVWLYLLWLDADSPSRRWLVADWAEEDDLEPIQTPTHSTTSESDR